MQARSSLSGGEISLKRRRRRRKKLCITARTTVRAPSDSLTRTETTRPSVVSLPAPGPMWSAMRAVSSITTKEPEWRCSQAWTQWAITQCSGVFRRATSARVGHTSSVTAGISSSTIQETGRPRLARSLQTDSTSTSLMRLTASVRVGRTSSAPRMVCCSIPNTTEQAQWATGNISIHRPAPAVSRQSPKCALSSCRASRQGHSPRVGPASSKPVTGCSFTARPTA